MLKMYHNHAASGDSPALWDEIWRSGGGFEKALYFCAVDPLRPLFERYADPGTRMLEGGCGRGQYVAYHAARGVRVVGLDFAQDTLAEIRKRSRSLHLCAGDVAALPFSDESFDLYYSGGVVEHFEAGADVALREAQRVLRPGGLLLVSVPYFSPLRRLLLPIKGTVWKRVSRAAIDHPDGSNGLQFFQYAYTQREFSHLLAKSGFHIVATQGYAILWGLYDLPLLQQVLSVIGRFRTNIASGTSGEKTRTFSQLTNDTRPSPSLLKRLVVGEDDALPITGRIIRALRWSCANMMMYICERRERLT